eukprot:gene11253-12433_t
MADDIGPQLPSFLKSDKSIKESNDDQHNSPTEDDVYGPVLPQRPINLKNSESCEEGERLSKNCKQSEEDLNATGDKSQMYGPALPPNLVEESITPIGPALPPGWNPSSDSESEEDDDLIGPALPSMDSADGIDQKRLEFEERALAMKNKLTGKSDNKEKELKRESWMTELPPELGLNIGIVARTFKKKTLNSTEADRSVWTDTPQDRERKRREQIEKGKKQAVDEPHQLSKRDIEMQQRVQQHNDEHRRGQSLLELHQEERKKKKNSGPEERRAFDRNVDLNSRNVDKKVLGSFMQTATKFNDKFENAKSGKKFL